MINAKIGGRINSRLEKNTVIVRPNLHTGIGEVKSTEGKSFPFFVAVTEE